MVNDKTRVGRHPERANYDRETIYSILDEGLVCHVAFYDGGQPFNIPMTYVRIENSLYIHSSNKSRLFSILQSGTSTCVTVTILDGIVLAKSAYSSSMNYRSVMIFGTMQEVKDEREKILITEKLIEKIVPGRWEDCRRPSKEELGATGLLHLKIDEFSAKIRSGQPEENPNDLTAPYWSGVIPISLTTMDPIPSPHNSGNSELPEYMRIMDLHIH